MPIENVEKSSSGRNNCPPHIKKHHFHHHASAVGFAGHITHPFYELLDAQGSCAVPPIGGYAFSHARDFEFKDIVSFSSCHSSVTSNYSEKDDAFFTVATSTIEDLDLLGIFKARKLVGRIMCRHEYHDPESDEDAPEPSIVPLGTRFEDVEVAGHPIQVFTWVSKLTELDTYAGFFREGNPIPFRRPRHVNDTINCALVEKLGIQAAPELTYIPPNKIEVKHFGVITLGRCMVAPRSRSIEMLHVNLACGTEGVFTASTPQGNGSPPKGGG